MSDLALKCVDISDLALKFVDMSDLAFKFIELLRGLNDPFLAEGFPVKYGNI